MGTLKILLQNSEVCETSEFLKNLAFGGKRIRDSENRESEFRDIDGENTHTKPEVPVDEVREVPEAVRTAGIPMITAERAAAQNTIIR